MEVCSLDAVLVSASERILFFLRAGGRAAGPLLAGGQGPVVDGGRWRVGWEYVVGWWGGERVGR